MILTSVNDATDADRLNLQAERKRRYESGQCAMPLTGQFYRWEVVSTVAVSEAAQTILKRATNSTHEIIHDVYCTERGIHGSGPSFHWVRVLKYGHAPGIASPSDLLCYQNVSLQWDLLKDQNPPWPIGVPAPASVAFINQWMPFLIKHYKPGTSVSSEARAAVKQAKRARYMNARAEAAKRAHEADLRLMEDAHPYIPRALGGRGRALPNDWNRPGRPKGYEKTKPKSPRIVVPAGMVE